MQDHFEKLRNEDREAIRIHPLYSAAFTANMNHCTSVGASIDALRNLKLLLLTKAIEDYNGLREDKILEAATRDPKNSLKLLPPTKTIEEYKRLREENFLRRYLEAVSRDPESRKKLDVALEDVIVRDEVLARNAIDAGQAHCN